MRQSDPDRQLQVESPDGELPTVPSNKSPEKKPGDLALATAGNFPSGNYPCDCRLTPDGSTVSPSLASAAVCIPPAAQTARRRGGGGRSGSPPRPTACRGARDLGTSFLVGRIPGARGARARDSGSPAGQPSTASSSLPCPPCPLS